MIRPRLLLTRPRPESRALAAALKAHGVDSLIEPMLTIRLDADARFDPAGAQAILLTSANGARALAAAGGTAARRLPVLAVGQATAEAARRGGFEKVESANGDVDDLAALAAARLRPEAGRLVHVAGRVSAGCLAGRLRAAGFEAVRVPLYEAAPARALSPPARRALEGQALAGAAFFSPRTAALLAGLVREAGLAPRVGTMTAFCLSDAVAAVATALPWRRVAVADAPRQDALVALVARANGAPASPPVTRAPPPTREDGDHGP